MKVADAVKPISFVKTHAAELILEMEKNGQPIIITQNSEAKAVLQNFHEYENTQQTLALLKILALSRKDLEQGRTKPAPEAFVPIRENIRARREA